MAVRAKLGRIIRPFRKAPASSSDPSA
jgi:hypothetical protein